MAIGRPCQINNPSRRYFHGWPVGQKGKAMHSNISRRRFLAQIGMGSALLSLGMFEIGCKSSTKLKEIHFYGTGTLDIGSDGWKSLEQDAGVRLFFKDNGNDAG